MTQRRDGDFDPSAERLSNDTPRASWYTLGLSDEIGDRLLMFDNSRAPSMELLRFRADLATPAFESALREHVRRLREFRSALFARVNAVEYLDDGGLALVSNYTLGKRTSEVLPKARGPAFATALIRQLTPPLAALQRQGDGFVHGALGLDRIIVAPGGRLTIVEHVLGPALNALASTRDQLSRLGIALRPDAERLDGLNDFFQLGLIALSFLVGTRIRDDYTPETLASLLEEFFRAAPRESHASLAPLGRWLERALQLNGQTFESLEEILDAARRLTRIDRDPIDPHPVRATRESRNASPDPTPSSKPTDREMVSAGDRPPDTDDVEPSDSKGSRAARAVVLALTLCAGAEAGVIAGLVYARWSRPPTALFVETTDPGAGVLVDGRSAGVTPLQLTVAEDARAIRVTGSDATKNNDAKIGTGGTASNLKARSDAAGSVRLSSPIELQVFEGRRQLSPSADGLFPVAPGRRELQLVNPSLGYRARWSLDVRAGEVVDLQVDPPKGRVSVTVVPWAEVFVDGISVGKTPLGSLPLALGEHEFTFRHPQLGERRQKAIVRSDGVTYVSANLRR
jgi:hypothetical protein